MRLTTVGTDVLCSECDSRWPWVCDFCKHYAFNGESLEGGHGVIYVNKGCCRLHFLPSDPNDGCEYFHCRMADGMSILRATLERRKKRMCPIRTSYRIDRLFSKDDADECLPCFGECIEAGGGICMGCCHCQYKTLENYQKRERREKNNGIYSFDWF